MGKSEEKQTEKRTHKATDGKSKHKNKPSFDAAIFQATDNDGGLRHSKWREFFRQLCEYKKQFGDCLVPKNYPANPKLGPWVAFQRYDYRDRKNKEIKSTGMIAEHIRALNGIGFEWSLTTNWNERFQQLCEYKANFGDCLVPAHYIASPQLGQWVSKQRTKYKLYQEGIPGPMTAERIQELENVGFIWGTSNTNLRTSWNERFEQLREFKVQFGHCLVPQQYAADPKLGRWVSKQRYQCKLYHQGKTSPMTAEHIRALESVDFE
jgi:hypothetical protein